MDLKNAFNIVEFGAKAGAQINPLNNAQAIQRAIDACSEAGRGSVIIPSGTEIVSGPFDIKSNVNFRVEKGARLIASPFRSHYKKSAFRENFKEGSVWIGGTSVKNVSFSGEGIIDGNGIAFMGSEQKAAFRLKPIFRIDRRPHVITIIDGKNLTFQSFTLKNAAYWGIHLAGCQDVQIQNITIANQLKIRNSDGIDLDHSKNVKINNCAIESGDDSICLKNRREYAEFGACENIEIRDCVMTSNSCAFKIGSENVDIIRNIIVDRCKIKRSNRGLGIQNRDEGTVENIVFSNIEIESRFFEDVWWGKSEPIYVTAFKRAASRRKDAKRRFAPGQTEGKVGPVRNIKFSNCVCKSENGIFVSGEPSMVQNVLFDNVEVGLNKITNYEGGVYDRRPCSEEGIIKEPTAGFYLDTVKNVILHNCRVLWGKNKPGYYTKSYIDKKVENLTVTNFEEKVL